MSGMRLRAGLVLAMIVAIAGLLPGCGAGAAAGGLIGAGVGTAIGASIDQPTYHGDPYYYATSPAEYDEEW